MVSSLSSLSSTVEQVLTCHRLESSYPLPPPFSNMANTVSRADGGSVTVSPSLRAHLHPLLESLAQCEPAASDDLLLYFHTCIDAVIGHAHSLSAFSPALTSHATSFVRLISLLASTIPPSASPTFDTLLEPLPTNLSSPLSLALTTRYPALLTSALHTTTALTPSHLTSFDYSVRLITASSHIATLNEPTTLLTLHRTNKGGAGSHRAAGDGSSSVSVELSVEQLDAVLGKLDEVAKLLQSTVP